MKPHAAPSSYAPGDARIALDSLEFLHGPAGEPLRERVAQLLATHPTPGVAEVSRLRKDYPPAVVHAALALGAVQKQAALKFPTLGYLWCVPEALEQATDAVVAAHKATRFAAAAPHEIVDLCAGIGGDTLALATVAPTTAVDLSPVRCACLRWNLERAQPPFPVTVITDDIERLLPQLPNRALFHIDPARRSGPEGNIRRSPRYEDLLPGPLFLEQLLARHPNGGIKLSPAVDFDSLPTRPAHHLELISHRGVVVQAMLWTGSLAQPFPAGTRTATILSEGAPPFSFTAPPTVTDLAPAVNEFLYEVDGSVTRAGIAGPLAAHLHLEALTPDGGYLTGDSPVQHPALTGFRVLNTLPYSPERVTAALIATGGSPGAVEVKTRGGLPGIDTDALQRLWNKTARVQRTVLLFRHGDERLAVIAARL